MTQNSVGGGRKTVTGLSGINHTYIAPGARKLHRCRKAGEPGPDNGDVILFLACRG